MDLKVRSLSGEYKSKCGAKLRKCKEELKSLEQNLVCIICVFSCGNYIFSYFISCVRNFIVSVLGTHISFHYLNIFK